MAADIVSGSLAFAIQNNGAAVGTRRALNLIQGANIGLTFLDVPASDRVNVTIALASVPGHTHAEADVTGLAADLAGKAPTSHTHVGTDAGRKSGASRTSSCGPVSSSRKRMAPPTHSIAISWGFCTNAH